MRLLIPGTRCTKCVHIYYVRGRGLTVILYGGDGPGGHAVIWLCVSAHVPRFFYSREHC